MKLNINPKQLWGAAWPHLLIVVIFAALSAFYFLPVLQGMQLPQGDNIHAEGAARELAQYQKETGELAQWTDAMFGGMPAYQIKADAQANIFWRLNGWSRLGLPYTTVAILFLYLLGFYVLLCSLGLSRWLAAIGAAAFALGSYNLIIIAAGHITKCYAIALSPVVLAGVIMVFRNRLVAGGLLTTIGLGMQLAYNHVQITYYLALTVAVAATAYLIYAVREKTLKRFAIQVGVLCAAAVLAVLPSATNMLTTQEYAKYSIRGARELTATGETDANTQNGLDKDYALAWSYGIHETPTLLIPNAVGGASGPIGENNKTVRQLPPQIGKAVAQSASAYWGGRMFTSGPVYVGAVVCLLFFLGCFFYKGKERWWLVAATVLSIMLAWGKNFPLLTDFMYYHFPMYNKFRTVEMTLVIATITIPTLGFLGLREIWKNPEEIRYNIGKFFVCVGLSGGAALLIALFPTAFYDFMTEEETAQFAGIINEGGEQAGAYAMFRQGIIDARVELTRSDAWRSVVFIVLASSALWFFSVRKLNRGFAFGTLALLIVIDLWGVDRRYLGEDKFMPKNSPKQNFVVQTADKAILNDKEPHRVLTLQNPFNDVSVSYFHQSVGGYHGAKLRRYQDLIDNYLAPEVQQLQTALQQQNVERIDAVLREAVGLNMLNAKYIIYNPNANPIFNPNAKGAAWFADSVVVAKSADEAIRLIGVHGVNKSANVAVVEADSEPGKTPTDFSKVNAIAAAAQADSTATIMRTLYKPDELRYKTSNARAGFAVLSEVYYPAGWEGTVDGNPTDIIKTDYVLRGVAVPAGEHEVVLRFNPSSYTVGKGVSAAGSALVVLLVLGAAVWAARKKGFL